MSLTPPHRRRWRWYETAAGRRPTQEPDDHAAEVLAAMKDVRRLGLAEARHLHGDLWEVRVDAPRVIYRVLFAAEGEASQVVLALEAFSKKTQKTPPETIRLAQRRLRDWRRRGRDPDAQSR